MRQVKVGNAPFIVKRVVTDYDLRSIYAQSECVRRLAQEYRLGENEAIAFTNERQNRFRILWKQQGIMYVIVPEINDENEKEVYLTISGTIQSWIPAGTEAFQNVVDLKRRHEFALANAKARAAK